MHPFKRGDRVVFKRSPGSPVKPGDKGIVLGMAVANTNVVYVRTAQGRACWLKVSDLELDDAADAFTHR